MTWMLMFHSGVILSPVFIPLLLITGISQHTSSLSLFPRWFKNCCSSWDATRQTSSDRTTADWTLVFCLSVDWASCIDPLMLDTSDPDCSFSCRSYILSSYLLSWQWWSPELPSGPGSSSEFPLLQTGEQQHRWVSIMSLNVSCRSDWWDWNPNK